MSYGQKLSLGIFGAKGRLGSEIFCLAKNDPTFFPLNLRSSDDFSMCDILLDVARPECCLEYLPKALSLNIPVVIGTTGHTKKQLEEIQKASDIIPLLLCPNFSYGVSILKQLLTILPNKGAFSIQEVHHKNKLDCPSGTALTLKKLLPKDTQISSERIDRVTGQHSVTLSLQGETLTLSHTAHSREVFALGALRACSFLYGKEPGLYTDFYAEHEDSTPCSR